MGALATHTYRNAHMQIHMENERPEIR